MHKMNLKLILLSLLTLFIWTLFSFTTRQSEKVDSIAAIDTVKSHLFLFGEYIYKREKCGSCHSLYITDNKTKISLDGLKGKYPVSWHYSHLFDPTIFVPNSEMPSFAFLADRGFEKDTIEKYCNKLSKQDWNKLISEAKTIKKELNEYGISSKSNAELIALISFLENIPQSEECKLIRSKEMEKAIRENAIRDSIWATSESVIVSVINNLESINLGQSIYKENCTPCHGYQGEGIIGPNLSDDYWLHGGKDNNIVKTIVNGVPDKGMMAWKYKFTPNEIGQLVAYIKSIKGTNPKNAKISQGTKE
jgi:cytochrome c oxidase cbb3-type subunit III